MIPDDQNKRKSGGNHVVKLIGLMWIVWSNLTGVSAQAASTVIPVAPEPVGSGARALGQSAFIAVADDATAASWNPAGLINLERPEASFVGVWKTIKNDPASPQSSIVLDGETWNEWEINFMSYAQPITVGNQDVVLAFNYHQVYDLGLEYKDITEKMAVRSKGAISTYSLAGGFSIPSLPELTLGASFNWYTRGLCNDDARYVVQTYPDFFGQPVKTKETLRDFSGYNVTFGLLWNAWEQEERLLTMGLVCHTPFTATTVRDEIFVQSTGQSSLVSSNKLDIDFPLSLGVGVNYRVSDVLSTACELQWTDWSHYTYTGATTSPSDTLACRWGIESLTFPNGPRGAILAYRGGVFYEPRPAWSDILPVYGFSLGLGWTVRTQFSLDFAYQFRYGEGEDYTVDSSPRAPLFDYGIQEHWLIGSVVTYF